MDDTKLRALLVSVESGSFSKAAAELSYTQSGLTHMMNRLEHELKCKLLNRDSTGVTLTEQGRELLPYIKNVVSATDALTLKAMECAGNVPKVIRLACFASISRSLLPDILAGFHKKCPDVKIEVMVNGRESVREMLISGDADIGLTDERCAPTLDWIPLYTAPVVAVVPIDFDYPENKSISLEKLLAHNFISSPEQYIDSELPNNFPRMLVDASDDATILTMVSSGAGVSAVSSLSLCGYESRVRKIPLEKEMKCSVGVTIKSLKNADKNVSAFVSYLYDMFKK